MKVQSMIAGFALSAALAVTAAAPAAAQQEHLEKELQGIDMVAVLNAREDTMKGMKRAMGELAKMIEGEAPYDAVMAADLAALIERNTRAIPSLFPPGTQIRGSDALDAVWEEPETFAERAEEANVIAGALVDRVALAQDVEDMERAFKDTALSCRACHKDFKKPF